MLSHGQVRVHERIHTGAKPYQCSYCDYKANQRGNMVVHERRHTGEKPYKCPYVVTGTFMHSRGALPVGHGEGGVA
jgi:uncharacterized Zn-finger protein